MPITNEALKPTLLVGIGGTGCEIADKVYALAARNQVLATKRIEILGFDTDDNDIKRHQHLKRGKLIRTSTPATVFQLLYSQHDQLQDWFVEDQDLTAEVRQMILMDGAGQLRMLSRLAFQAALEDPRVSADLDNALNGLATHDNIAVFQGHVNVLLVGSLAGGTGSGMFLQTALLLGHKLRERGFNPEIRGLFLLPDIFVRAARLPVDQIPSVLANGYAALRELNAIMLQTTGRSELPVKFSYARGLELQPDGMPLVSVVLMDYENIQGGNLGRNFDAYKETAVRAAYTQLFTPVGGRMASIAINDARTRVAAAARGGVNYYAGIGVGAVVYPQEEILRYLSLQFGLGLLEGEWLRLDEEFNREYSTYHQRINNGETNLKPPARAESYISHLQLLAKERVRFFREIHERVEHPRVKGQDEEEAGAPQHQTYLNALETQVKKRFWESDDKLSRLLRREGLAGESLTERAALANDVRALERELRQYRQAIEDALENVPHDLFHNIVLGGDTRSEAEWTEYHFQSYTVRSNPHLVQVRYFLYQVLLRLRERTAELVDEKKHKALEALAQTTVFDDPKTPDRIEGPMERAIQIAESRWPTWIDRTFHRFAVDYRDHFNLTLAMLRQYAEGRLLRRAYELLDRHIRDFSAILERFFSELAALRDDLRQNVNESESAHQPGTGAADGNRYVFASRAAKQALWEELRQKLAGVSADDDSNAALTQALYERFKQENRPDRWKVLPPFSGKSLFRQNMVERFCHDTLRDKHQDAHDFSVLEAIRREAVLDGRPWQEFMQYLIDLVAYQAEPYLSLNATDPTGGGQRIMFWAVAPAVKDGIGDEALFESLFKRNNGEQPLSEDQFSPHELLCVNMRVNLTLQQLRKLHPGDPGVPHIGAPQAGVYYQAYQNMVRRILDDKKEHPDRPARDFTPHLDRHWHKPGVLPAIFPEETQSHLTEFMQGYVLGVALEQLAWEERFGRPVTVFHDWKRRGAPAGERVVSEAHDDLALLEQLRVAPEMTAVILEQARRIRDQQLDREGQRVERPEQTQLYLGLRAPETLARLLRLSTNRNLGKAADDRTSQAVAVLFQQFQAYIRDAMPALAVQEQRELFARESAAQIQEALALLSRSDNPLREETSRVVRELAEGARSRLVDER